MQQKFETVKKATPSPTSAASFFRSVIESQLAAVPGAKAAFQKFDELAEVHGDEVSDIISKTYNEVWEAVEKGGDDVSGKVAEILKKRGAQLKDVGIDAGDRILSEHPEVKEKLGYAFDEVKGWTDQYGPEAKKQAEEVYSEIQKMVASGLSVESITRAKKLVEEKKAEVEKLGKKAAQQAYEKGEQQAQEVLKKYPEVKETLYKYKDQLIGGGVSASAIPMIFKQLSGLKGSGEENAQKLKDYIEDTIEKGKKKGSQFADSDTLKDVVGMAQQYLKSIPGGEKVRKTPRTTFMTFHTNLTVIDP